MIEFNSEEQIPKNTLDIMIADVKLLASQLNKPIEELNSSYQRYLDALKEVTGINKRSYHHLHILDLLKEQYKGEKHDT